MSIAGSAPRTVVEPQSIEELADCTRGLYARGTPFAFAGGETEMELGNAPRSLDTLVRTTACNRVIDYAPEDQTITLEAGMTIAQAAQVLAREGQFLAIDAPDPERATIGGAIATNLYGSRRLRYGGIKDTIVGVEIVRPDGVRARGGGKVVKNVAGFDMPKLMVGSLGTLGAIVSATFRVYPLPQARATLTFAEVTVEEIAQVCAEVTRAALVPASVTAFGAELPGRYACDVSFEGFTRGVQAQMDNAATIASVLGLAARVRPDTALAVDEREIAVRRSAPWRVTLAAAPTALARFLSATPRSGGEGRVVYPMLGSAFIGADSLDADTIARWRRALDGGSVVVTAMPPEARSSVDAWGEPPASSLGIMRLLKAGFDPKGLCNAGRFVGGL